MRAVEATAPGAAAGRPRGPPARGARGRGPARSSASSWRRCGIGDLAGIEVDPAAVGTDGEFAALHIARRRATERLVNIVIAPDETGSGVPDAARGRHFATETPHGAAVAKGEPLAGLDAGDDHGRDGRDPRGRTAPPARSPRSMPRSSARARARARRRRPLPGPSARCLQDRSRRAEPGGSSASARAIGDRIEVVVDACQMRLRPERLRSGSRARLDGAADRLQVRDGPALRGRAAAAGAARRRARPVATPAGGLRSSTSPGPNGPQPGSRSARSCPPRPNLGLLFRWRAALFEMQALDAVPEALRTRIMAELGAAIRGGARERPRTSTRSSRRSATAPRPSSRSVSCAGCGRRLPTAEPEAARQVWRWLREDLADRLPVAARRRRAAARGASSARSVNRSRSAPPARSGCASARV